MTVALNPDPVSQLSYSQLVDYATKTGRFNIHNVQLENIKTAALAAKDAAQLASDVVMAWKGDKPSLRGVRPTHPKQAIRGIGAPPPRQHQPLQAPSETIKTSTNYHSANYAPPRRIMPVKQHKPSKPKTTSVNVSQPATKSKVMKLSTPTISRMSNGNVRISHKEYVGDLISTASTGFALELILPVDPAEPSTFPWLSSVALQYEQFSFKKLKMLYVTEAATSTAGAVMLAYDPNAGRLAPSSKVLLLETKDCLRTPVWQSTALNCSVDTSRKYTQAYNNFGPVQGFTAASLNPWGSFSGSANTDVRNVASGVVYVGTSGVSTSTTAGEIWLDYEVELYAPALQVPPPTIGRVFLGSTANSSFAFNDFIGCTSNVANLALFGTIPFNIGPAGSGNAIGFRPFGNCIVILTMPTSSASSSALMSFSSTPSGVTATDLGTSTGTTGFTTIYALTGITPNMQVTGTQSGSWTNLSFSDSAPGKIYIAPYDVTAAGTSGY